MQDRVSCGFSGFGRYATACCAVLASVGFVHRAVGADAFTATVEVRGLRIVGAGYGDEQMMRPFNWVQGVTVVLLVTVPQGGLIAFDRKASEIKSLTDDKGTDLLVKAGAGFPGFTGADQISEDGKALLVELNGSSAPAKGARSIKAQGAIAVRTGSEQKSHRAEKVAVKVGTEIIAGDVTFAIVKVGKPSWGDMPLRIDLQTSDNIDSIASIRFLDSAGKEIDSSRGGTTTKQMGSQRQITQQYNLAGKVDELTVEVSYWSDMQTKVVPFDVELQVGL